MSAAESNDCLTCPVRNEEAKPLRSYLDRALFGLFSIILLWAGNRMDTYGQKLDENTGRIVALTERMEAYRERLERVERLDRLERQEQLGKRGRP